MPSAESRRQQAQELMDELRATGARVRWLRRASGLLAIMIALSGAWLVLSRSPAALGL